MPFLPPRWRRSHREDAPAPADPPAADSVVGADLQNESPYDATWDQRIAEMEAADPEGARVGGLRLEHPDELIPYIDVEPSSVPGYTWTVGLYDEIRLFVDDDALSEAEERDAFEARFAAAPGVSAAMREDREIIHLAATGMSAAQAHSLAVEVIADAVRAGAELDDHS